MKFTLIYDAREEADVKETLLPMLENMISGSRAFSEEKDGDAPQLSPDEPVLLYLTDNQIKSVLKSLGEADVTLAALPHPGAERFCAISGAGSDLGKAVAHLKDVTERAEGDADRGETGDADRGESGDADRGESGDADRGEKNGEDVSARSETGRDPKKKTHTVDIDLLHCNGRQVFSSVVIGSTFLLATSKFYKSIGLLKRTWNFLGSFLKLRPFKLEITTALHR